LLVSLPGRGWVLWVVNTNAVVGVKVPVVSVVPTIRAVSAAVRGVGCGVGLSVDDQCSCGQVHGGGVVLVSDGRVLPGTAVTSPAMTVGAVV